MESKEMSIQIFLTVPKKKKKKTHLILVYFLYLIVFILQLLAFLGPAGHFVEHGGEMHTG